MLSCRGYFLKSIVQDCKISGTVETLLSLKMDFYLKTKDEAIAEIKFEYLFVDRIFHPSRAHRKFQSIIKCLKDVKMGEKMNNVLKMTSRLDVNPAWLPDMI